MKLTNKEQFLLKSGRKMETITFCKDLKIPQNHIVWFVDKIEKEGYSLESKQLKENLKLVLKMFNRNVKMKEILKSLKSAIIKANQFTESDESEKRRILHTFPDKKYIIQLTYKELYFEGKKMSNCLNNLYDEVKNKEIAILALKDEKSKTLSHIQISKYGTLEQHYEFANSNMSLKNWGYINDFFKIYESKSFKKIIEEKELEKKYDINFSDIDFYVSSKLPYERKVSFFEEENKDDNNSLNSKFLKEYNINFNESLHKDLNCLNYESLIKNLKIKKEIMLNLFDELIKSIEMSKENFFLLNDEVYLKIFGKKITALERFKNSLKEKEDKLRPIFMRERDVEHNYIEEIAENEVEFHGFLDFVNHDNIEEEEIQLKSYENE